MVITRIGHHDHLDHSMVIAKITSS